MISWAGFWCFERLIILSEGGNLKCSLLLENMCASKNRSWFLRCEDITCIRSNTFFNNLVRPLLLVKPKNNFKWTIYMLTRVDALYDQFTWYWDVKINCEQKYHMRSIKHTRAFNLLSQKKYRCFDLLTVYINSWYLKSNFGCIHKTFTKHLNYMHPILYFL